MTEPIEGAASDRAGAPPTGGTASPLMPSDSASTTGAMRYLWILNNFIHDMATGTWAACVLVDVLLDGRRAALTGGAAGAVSEAMVAVFYLAVVALLAIAATGGIRLSYWRRQSLPEEADQKRRALLVKHGLFAVVYGGGTLWLYALVR